LKFSIGNRLFLAMLLSALAVAAVTVELVRWKLFDNFTDHPIYSGTDRVDDLVAALSTQYREHNGWSFLPADSAARKKWLFDQWERTRNSRDVVSAPAPTSPTLGFRLGLLDRDRRHLAGVVASPLMIALASIDRQGNDIVAGGETVGHLIVARPQNPDDELAVAFLIQQQENLLRAALIALLLGALAAALLAESFRRPIRRLVDGARRLGNGRFETRMRVRRSDELGELARTFDQLAAKLEDAERSRRQWIADTSHELRTPLAVLRAQIEGLQDRIRTATPENIELMSRQVRSLTKLVDELYELACADVGQLSYDKAAHDVWRLVEDVLRGFAEKFVTAGLTATVGAAPTRSTMHCDADRLRQVVTNLLENCRRYTAAGGRIEVTGTVVAGELHIAIDDSAPAVPAASIARLGERFFRIEASRNRQLGGAGLGLALCKQILAAHGGRLDFAASALGELRATIVLPMDA